MFQSELKPAEDVVEYYIFVNKDVYPTLACVDKLKNEITEYTDVLIGDYIWQEDNFELSISQGHSDSGDVPTDRSKELYLYGITKFGDNMEDEAVITYLLFEISKKWPGLYIRFVLIDI